VCHSERERKRINQDGCSILQQSLCSEGVKHWRVVVFSQPAVHTQPKKGGCRFKGLYLVLTFT